MPLRSRDDLGSGLKKMPDHRFNGNNQLVYQALLKLQNPGVFLHSKAMDIC